MLRHILTEILQGATSRLKCKPFSIAGKVEVHLRSAGQRDQYQYRIEIEPTYQAEQYDAQDQFLCTLI